MVRAALLLMLVPLVATAEQPDPLSPKDFAYGIPLEMDGDGALYRFALPEVVYRTTTRRDLGDMRIFNGYNEVVPHLLRHGAGEVEAEAASLALPLFPLYEQEGGEGDTQLRITTDESGALVDFRRRVSQPKTERISHYLIDASALQRPIEKLSLRWDETGASILEGVDLEYSNDLTHWQPVSRRFTLAALSYQGYRLGQRELSLPALQAPYLRLSWPLGQKGIRLREVQAEVRPEAEAPPHQWLTLSPSGEQSGLGRYTFNSGGHFPVDRLQVRLPQPNTVVHARLYSRNDGDEEWHLRHQGLLYNLQREGHTLRNDAVSLASVDAPHWRLEVTNEGGGLGQGQPRLELGWSAHQLSFVARGETPFSLAFGAAGVEPIQGGLAPLLHTLEQSRKGEGFIKSARPGGHHPLGGERRLKPAPPPLPWKRWLLWAVLVLGVLMLALMARHLMCQMSDDSRID